jgi:hypothetical protein
MTLPNISAEQLYRFIDACTIGNSHGEHGVPERIHLDRLANVINREIAQQSNGPNPSKEKEIA